MMEKRTDYVGNDIGNVGLGNGLADLTEDSCAAACKVDDDCKFWTLSSSWKRCFFKSSDAGRKESNEMVSGIKPCN